MYLDYLKSTIVGDTVYHTSLWILKVIHIDEFTDDILTCRSLNGKITLKCNRKGYVIYNEDNVLFPEVFNTPYVIEKFFYDINKDIIICKYCGGIISNEQIEKRTNIIARKRLTYDFNIDDINKKTKIVVVDTGWFAPDEDYYHYDCYIKSMIKRKKKI